MLRKSRILKKKQNRFNLAIKDPSVLGERNSSSLVWMEDWLLSSRFPVTITSILLQQPLVEVTKYDCLSLENWHSNKQLSNGHFLYFQFLYTLGTLGTPYVLILLIYLVWPTLGSTWLHFCFCYLVKPCNPIPHCPVSILHSFIYLLLHHSCRANPKGWSDPAEG